MSAASLQRSPSVPNPKYLHGRAELLDDIEKTSKRPGLSRPSVAFSAAVLSSQSWSLAAASRDAVTRYSPDK